MHQNYLVDNLVPSSSAYQDAIKAATEMLISQGVAPAAAQEGAIGLISQQVTQQATLLAYMDVFFTSRSSRSFWPRRPCFCCAAGPDAAGQHFGH